MRWLFFKFAPISLQSQGEDVASNLSNNIKTSLPNLSSFQSSHYWQLNQSFFPFSWQVAVPSSFVGLVLENSPLPYTNHGHVILADPSPVLFYPISSYEIRCLVDVPGQKVPSISSGEMAHYLKTAVAPQVRNTLHYFTKLRICHATYSMLLLHISDPP